MKHYFWFILFLSVLLFDVWSERAFIMIYYTMWTFLLETVYFGLLIVGIDSKHLFETIFAPSIVVCMGFWLVIAPTYISSPKPNNAMFVIVTHGFNAAAMVAQNKRLVTKSIWKPLAYTFVYNLFLVLYVGAGGRSISGRRPYWYAQYDRPIGWVFFGLSLVSVAVIHTISSTYIWPERERHETKQYIV